MGILQTLTVIDTNHVNVASIPVLTSFDYDLLTVQSAEHANVASIPVLNIAAWLGVFSANHDHVIFTPEIGGGLHINTKHIDYGGINYLRCRHRNGNLQGVYKSPIFDTAVGAARYLVYIVGQDTGEPDIVIVGTGTTWDSQVPVPATWGGIGIATNTWTNIFELDQGPSVTMRLYYGATSPPTSYVDKMEILSAIVTARYFQVQININDPVGEVYAYVEEFYLRFCQ